MAFWCVYGTTGSGKTYLTSSFMKKVYDKKNRQIFTNINLKINHDDIIKPLIVENLYAFAEKELALFNYYKAGLKQLSDEEKYREELEDEKGIFENKENIEIEEKTENKLILDDKFSKNDIQKYRKNYDDYLKASGLLDEFGGSIIYWDEAQNDLTELDAVWVRFFSYHRHYNSMDIVLCTQDVMLIHRKYRVFVHKFYSGQNASKRLISTILRYKVYTDAREFDKHLIETISLPMKKEIHNFYDSGEKNVDKSTFLKRLLIPIVGIFIIYMFYQFMFGTKSNEEENIDAVPKELVNIDNNETEYEEDDEDNPKDDKEETHLVIFNCNIQLCNKKNSSFIIPLKKMAKFSEIAGIEILFSEKITNEYSLVMVSMTDELYKNLSKFDLEKKEDTDEKNGVNFISHTPFK